MDQVLPQALPLQVPSIYADGTAPQELYYMIPIKNLMTIFKKGILSHQRAARIADGHVDISDNQVQERRASTWVNNPDRISQNKKMLTIHRYANFYLNAHNAMMYVRKNEAEELCVLRINPIILGRNEVVIADQNASTDNVTFNKASTYKFNEERTQILQDKIAYWRDESPEKQQQNKKIRQAEVLVPYQLHASFIMGIYTCSISAKQVVTNLFKEKPYVPIDIHPTLFFKANDFPPSLQPITASKPFNLLYPALNETFPESSSEEG